MADEPRDIADAFNRLFDLDLDWERRLGQGDEFLIKRSDQAQLHELCAYLFRHLKATEIQNAIWVLTQNKSALHIPLLDASFMESVGITEEDSKGIQEQIATQFNPGLFYIREQKKTEILRRDQAREFRSPDKELFRELASREEYQEIMRLFYDVERRQLLEAGLNQGSVAIIIQRVKDFETQIIQNLQTRSSVLTGKYVRAIDALQTFVKKVSSGSRTQSTALAQRVRLPSGKTIAKSRDKIIGLATLWGDAVPLLTSKDWGIASVISATAGATIASILPSGKSHE
ncbi:hypothetical protein [Bradyrhizobium sp. YR681]|uniref:hypothetical protein n=1 Tax=Bradyrhizobium sp. YR681 TaxID=1144344 RepID=UPI0005639126|nr:hypothetical protein [Bradyrhizobium sp. YR681]